MVVEEGDEGGGLVGGERWVGPVDGHAVTVSGTRPPREAMSDASAGAAEVNVVGLVHEVATRLAVPDEPADE